MDIQDGYYYSIQYQKREDVFFPDGLPDMETLHMGYTRLSITTYDQIYRIIPEYSPRPYYALTKKQLDGFKKYMTDSLDIDFVTYEYFLSLCVEDWFYDERNK